MKTIVWAALTANGSYARASETRVPPKEALEDFAVQAKAAGNFIAGRKTIEAFFANPGRRAEDTSHAFSDVTVVVVSSAASRLPGVLHASSPSGALELLKGRGHSTALVGGGETLINSFLAEGLVDELVVNILPAIDDEGMRLVLPNDQYRRLLRKEMRDLGDGIVRLHYALNPRQ